MTIFDRPALSPRRRQFLAALASVPFAGLARAGTPSYPSRPIRLVVPFPAGGGVDVFARPLAPALSRLLGVPVVVENIGGAASRIGSQAVARAQPDGYTLLLTNDTLVASDAVHATDLAEAILPRLRPVSLAIASCNLLVTHPGSGIASAEDYVQRMREQPGAVNIGVPGWGTAHHLSSALLNHQVGVTAEHIPYRGGAPLLLDVLSGTLDAGIVTMAAALGHIQNGTLRGIAVTSSQRASALPDVQTLTESVAPGYEHLTWQGVLAPAGTPDAVADRLQAAIAEALTDPEVSGRLPGLGFDPVGENGRAFSHRLDDTFLRFNRLVASTGIQPSRA